MTNNQCVHNNNNSFIPNCFYAERERGRKEMNWASERASTQQSELLFNLRIGNWELRFVKIVGDLRMTMFVSYTANPNGTRYGRH